MPPLTGHMASVPEFVSVVLGGSVNIVFSSVTVSLVVPPLQSAGAKCEQM